MKARNAILASALLAAALSFGGCAQDGALTTSAVTPDKPAATAAAKTDPACATLASQIETLRKDETVANLEKAASGKSKVVEVKRTSLAKQAELNKANADFQAKCAPAPAKAQTAQAAPAAADAAKKAATPADATTKATAAATVDAAKDTAKETAKDTAKAAAKDAAAKAQ